MKFPSIVTRFKLSQVSLRHFQRVSFPEGIAIGKIPATATMKFVNSIQMYEAFQRGIRELAKEARVPPITLDCIAWDAGHEKKSLSAVAVVSPKPARRGKIKPHP